jgi:hypothetical protein
MKQKKETDKRQRAAGYSKVTVSSFSVEVSPLPRCTFMVSLTPAL